MRMVFNGKSRVAIAAIITMISKKELDGIYNLQELSATLGVSLSYLEQIFAVLRKAGLVVSMRGPGGGYRVERDHSTLTVYDVINSLEPQNSEDVFQSMVYAQLRCIRLSDLVGHVKNII